MVEGIGQVGKVLDLGRARNTDNKSRLCRCQQYVWALNELQAVDSLPGMGHRDEMVHFALVAARRPVIGYEGIPLICCRMLGQHENFVSMPLDTNRKDSHVDSGL